MFNKLKQFKDLRDQAKHLQSELEKEVISVNVAANQIVLTMNGNMKITGLAIDDTLLNPAQKEKLVNGIKEAHDEALTKMQRVLAMKMKEMGGLPNIPGFN